MKDRGIRFEKSSPDTPEQNGDAECQNRTIFDRVRTILIDAGLPLFLWAEAVNYIIYTKIAMSLVPSPTQLLLRSAIRRNRTSQNFTPLVVRLMSMTIHPSAKSYPLELLKAFLLGMQRHKRLFGSIFPRREALFVLSMLNAM